MTSQQSDNELRDQRVENMRRLEELGYAPFGGAFERTGDLAAVRTDFVVEKQVRIAGRLVAKRDMGKSIFGHIQDGTDRFQIYVKKNLIGEEAFAAFKVLDLGDHVGLDGELFVTRTEEQTLKVTGWQLLSKALLPLPEKWHGLQDIETRYRQRYLDLIANQEVREVFNKRIAAIGVIRDFLKEHGFLEVETPMIQSMAGGAAAKPFQTRYEALGADMFFRIAPELYLKRLLVGGFDKVFELNRNFRNEGLDKTHNPEFTMLEIYEAFGDMRSMQSLIQDLVTTVAREVMGTLLVGREDAVVDLTPPWRNVTYHELVREVGGEDWFDLSLDQLRERATELEIEFEPDSDEGAITQELFEKKIEKTLINPTFVTRLPAALVPLAKPCSDDPTVVDVFELIVGGNELAPGYSELNDPVEQRRRFEAQAAGDAARVDEDFLQALEYGMPPAGGMGVGIDRLMIVLTGVESIRDVILFPHLRAKN